MEGFVSSFKGGEGEVKNRRLEPGRVQLRVEQRPGI